MTRSMCARAEILAGAIALDEASDAERDEYRRHLAGCAPCIASLGGEREIERIATYVKQARDSETWAPVLSPPWQIAARSRKRSWQLGITAAVCAAAAIFAFRLIPSFGLGHSVVAPVQAVAIAYNPARVAVHRPAVALSRPGKVRPAAPQRLRPPQTRLLIVHNVVNLARSSAVAAVPAHRRIVVVAPQAPPESNVPIWRRGVGSNVNPSNVVAQAEAAPAAPPRADSMEIAPGGLRGVEPVGGESAINPNPPMIAYAEGAEGTTAFEVAVNERGLPTKCTITKSSGYLVLDHAVCKAAMAARFIPRAINGHNLPGVYHDAFTFHTANPE